MEADSTTLDSTQKTDLSEAGLPFLPCPGNLGLYKELTKKNGDLRLEPQIIKRMQIFGLLPDCMRCPTNAPDCRVVTKPARVVDRVQWVCEGCEKRQPIRAGSFFLRLPCSVLQALQAILAWSEDVDCDVTAHHFGIKPKVACSIYDKLDELAVRQQNKLTLGGEGSVVLAEMYPDCLTRLSPDTTDQPHMHRILMVADTNHIPTHYQLHVIKDSSKKNTNRSQNKKSLKAEVEEVLSRVTAPGSKVVTGSHVPAVPGASPIQQLVQYCDADMQHFLTCRIWRQAVTVCAASRDLCSDAPTALCATAVQRYLDAALYRLRHSDGFYGDVLKVLAEDYTVKTEEVCNE